MKKNIVLGIIALIVTLTLSFYVLNNYIYEEKQADRLPELKDGTEREITGTVTEVNLDGVAFDAPALIMLETDTREVFTIAVPSMGLPQCSAVLNIANVYEIAAGDRVSVRGVKDGEGRIVPCGGIAHHLHVLGVYTDYDAGFTFSYRREPDGYRDIGEDLSLSTDESFLRGVVLINKKEQEAMGTSADPREGPPTIQVQIYTNSEQLSPAVWAGTYPRETNTHLAISKPEETFVGGEKAVYFVSDGLYLSEVFVVESGEHMILLRGEYIDTDSDIYRTFSNIVKSIAFIPSNN